MQANGVKLTKICKGEDVTRKSAFAYGSVLDLYLEVPCALGAQGAVLRGNCDGCGDVDVAMTVCKRTDTATTYTCTLDTTKLCRGEQSGLYYFEFLLLKGFDTMFTESINNVDFYLSRSSGARFRMLIFESDYTVPAWFGKGVMYHIFVDRFCRGEGAVGAREDAEINPDWENGVPQYAPYPGAPVSNNVFFGGNLWGVIEKLDYLKLNAIPKAFLKSTEDKTQDRPITDAENVSYTYNSNNLLETLSTESTTYRFTYDAFGNPTDVKIGGNTVSSYTYNERNGKLNKVTYNNGLIVEYFYNDLGIKTQCAYHP